jgi:hypothetical protein
MSREGDFWGIVRSAEVTSTFDWEAEDWEALALAFADLPYDPSLRRSAAKRVWRLPGIKVMSTVFVLPKIQQEDPIFLWMTRDLYLRVPLSSWHGLWDRLQAYPDRIGDNNPPVRLFVSHPKNVMNLPEHLPLGRLIQELSWSEVDLLERLVLAPVFAPAACKDQISGGETGSSCLLQVLSPWAGVPLSEVLYRPAGEVRGLMLEPLATCFLKMWERT